MGNRYHHYLAYNIDQEISVDEKNPQSYIDDTKAQGGFGFIAHPFERGCPLFEGGRAFTWNDWTVEGYDGICIWNYSSAWKEKVKTLIHGIYYYLNRRATLRGASERTLASWDKACAVRKVVAIGGSDAHAFYFRLGFLKFTVFPYDYLFKAINTHILLDNPLGHVFEEDKKRVYGALRKGRCFVAHDMIGDSKGFRFMALADDKRVIMGENLYFQEGLHLWVLSPRKALIKLIKDGRLIFKTHGRIMQFPVRERGVYRVELEASFLFSMRPWIYSNPIYII